MDLKRERRVSGVTAAWAVSLAAAPAHFRVLIILTGWRRG
jgi:hypothetical protein